MLNANHLYQINHYINQIEAHVQSINQLLNGLRSLTSSRYQSWQPNTPYPGYGTPTYSHVPGTYFGSNHFPSQPNGRVDVFKLFDQHKETLSPIQDMFNPSITNDFAYAFSPDIRPESEPGKSNIVSAWVEDVRLHVIDKDVRYYSFKLKNSLGAVYNNVYSLEEFAKATANNGVLSLLLGQLTRNPSVVNGRAWLIEDQYLVTVNGVGSFVSDSAIHPLLRFNQPIVDIREQSNQDSAYGIADEGIQLGAEEPPAIHVIKAIDKTTTSISDFHIWLNSNGVIDQVQRTSEGVIEFHFVSKGGKCTVVETSPDVLTKWRNISAPIPTKQNVLSRIVKQMKNNSNVVTTLVTIDDLDIALIKVIGDNPNDNHELYVTDSLRGNKFAAATNELNCRWFDIK